MISKTDKTQTAKTRTLALLVAVLCLPSFTFAIGVSARPATLSIRTTAGKDGTTRFAVSNPSREVGLFETYPEEFDESITLIPSRFVLEAGESREVLVRARSGREGVVRTAIAIEAQPLGVGPQSIGGGIRLPLSVEVGEKTALLAGVSASSAGQAAALLLLCLLTALVLLRAISLFTLKSVV